MIHTIGIINTDNERIVRFGLYENFIGRYYGEDSKEKTLIHFRRYFQDKPLYSDLQFGLFKYQKGKLILSQKL